MKTGLYSISICFCHTEDQSLTETQLSSCWEGCEEVSSPASLELKASSPMSCSKQEQLWDRVAQDLIQLSLENLQGQRLDGHSGQPCLRVLTGKNMFLISYMWNPCAPTFCPLPLVFPSGCEHLLNNTLVGTIPGPWSSHGAETDETGVSLQAGQTSASWGGAM